MKLVDRALRRLNRRLAPGHLRHGPRWVILGVNNACNLSCRMCDVGTGESDTNFARQMLGSSPMQMPMELAARVIDQVALHFPSARLGFAFTEPSSWPHLVPAVTAAHARGIGTSVTTNGLLLPKLARPLGEAGLDELVVSLDGPPAIHDHIRRRAGSFARAVEGIRLVPTSTRVSVFCAVTQWNIGHLGELIDALPPGTPVGMMHTVFVRPEAAAAHNREWGERYPATASNTRELDLPAYDLDRLWGEIQALGDRVSWSPHLRTRADLDRYYRDPSPFGRRCADVFEDLLVKSDGSVVPAHSRCYPVELGNLYTTELDALWNAPAAARLRRDLQSTGALFPGCDRCCSAR